MDSECSIFSSSACYAIESCINYSNVSPFNHSNNTETPFKSCAFKAFSVFIFPKCNLISHAVQFLIEQL